MRRYYLVIHDDVGNPEVEELAWDRDPWRREQVINDRRVRAYAASLDCLKGQLRMARNGMASLDQVWAAFDELEAAGDRRLTLNGHSVGDVLREGTGILE